MKEEEYLDINKQLWDAKTDIHWDSEFYDVKSFLKNPNTLKEIEIPLLGEIKGKSILHLQCHFGQDTLSMAKLGADVTGLDISTKSIEKARELNNQLGLNGRFVESDVYSAKEHINEKFDIVFSSYGTIGWLPDMKKWADIVQHFIKPGGRFIFAELHPFIWMHNETFDEIPYSYFNGDPIVESTPGTYADEDADICKTEIGWNHDLGEVIGNLLKAGLRLDHFQEYNFSPHNCFKHMHEISPGRFVLDQFGDKVPLSYSLAMTKES